MDMVTELVVEEVQIQGGRKIRTAAYNTPNMVLYHSLTWLGKALRWLMESKSNNMTRGIQPSDVRKLWKLWEAHKQDMDLGQQFSDSPSPVLEFNHKILLPHPSEMRAFKNIKIQRIASQLHSYCHTCMSRDSADGTHIYEMSDYEQIKEARAVVEAFMKLVVGTGEPIEGEVGKWDTGMDIPALVELGREIPSGDLDILTFAEPSFDAPSSHLPDAPDRDQ